MAHQASSAWSLRWSFVRKLACLVLGVAPTSLQGQAYAAARHGGNYMHNYYFPPAPSSTPWAPTWSPDGNAVAIAMSGSIWTVDLATGAATEVTYGPTYHSLPDWSPDGQWIVYTADDKHRTIQLEIVNLVSGASHALTDDEHIYTDPAFSPDGRLLAYVSTKPNGYFNVYVRPIRDGQWVGDEIAITRDNDFGRSRLYFGRWDMHITPTWMPDGSELLFISNRGQALGSGHVLRVPVERNGIARARTVLADQTLYRTRPHVSPDGKRFVYSSSSGAADQFNNLYVQPTVGGEPYKLTFFEHDAFHPRWSPDGQWIAYISNEAALPQLALLETYGGQRHDVRVTSRGWKRPMGSLSVLLADSATGGSTAARIHLTASDGKLYAPEDAYARVGWAGDPLFHAQGYFEVTLPVGTVRLTAVKGFEYWPRSLELEIEPDKVTSGTMTLVPMADMSAHGWYSGSTHVHMNYAGNLRNSLENLMMMSAAEDQDIVNEQIANKDNRVLDHQFFIPGGMAHPISQPDRLLVVGQEYRPPFYGHVFMLGLRDHLISPFVTGYEGTAIESLYPSNTDMLRKARAQGATVGYVHPFSGDRDPLDGNLGGAKGFMVDAVLGTTDALEWSVASRAGFYPLYAVWNNGIRVTATGGEDSISDLQRSKLVGSIRTYVCTDQRGLTMDGWFAGLRDGRAFVSNGPLVDFAVDGRTPGHEVRLPPGGADVAVTATVQSITPLERFVVVYNGQTVDEVQVEGARRRLTYSGTFAVTQSGWFHVLAEGADAERFPLDVQYAQAFTNPVWVFAGDQPVRDRESAEYGVRWIDKLQGLAEAWPGWRSQREVDHVLGQFQEARRLYIALAAEDSSGEGQPAKLIGASLDGNPDFGDCRRAPRE